MALPYPVVPTMPCVVTQQPGTPALATIPGWEAISGMKRSSTYNAAGRGDLRMVKVGRRTMIDVAHGLAWLRSLPEARITTGQRRTAPACAEAA